MSTSVLLVASIALPFFGAVVAGMLPIHARTVAAWLGGAVAVLVFALAILAFPRMSMGEVLRYEVEWMPSLGLNFVLRLDGFAWMFLALIAAIGALVMLYARYYMSAEDPVPRFFSFLLAFMGSMIGVVLSGNLVQLAFFWELTSLFSFLLIGYWYHTAAARDGARISLTVTALGGLCLFAGVLLIGRIVGSYDLDVVLAAGDQIREHALYLPALILVLLGALTKSAQFPFHFWLPQAMAAPTPVSAYLHSATLVKAGVFLMARLWPVLAGTDAWFLIVGGAGIITLLLGAYVAIFENDLKGLLAYSTISHLGLITLLLGMNSEVAMVAAIFHIMNHATFKASLFMAAGIIDHETGTRDIRRLSGLHRSMPFTTRLAMVAAAAMAGVPLLNGFLSKEMFFAQALAVQAPSPWLLEVLPLAAMLGSAFGVTYSLRFIHGAFFGPEPTDLPRPPKEPPSWMRFPVEVLVLACIIVGILPAATVGLFLHNAVQSILGSDTPEYSLALWHGFTPPLLMSFIAFLGGVILYLLLQNRLKKGIEFPPLIPRLEGRRMFEVTMVFLSWRLSRFLEGILSTRRLQPQLRLVLCAALAAGGLAVYLRGVGPGNLTPAAIDPALAVLWAVGAAGALGAAWQAKYHRLAALILMGVAGLVICVTFVWFSAPDLALTQLLVEVVTTVLLLLGLRWLPKRFETPETRQQDVITISRRLFDLAIAIAAGAAMAGLAFAVMTRMPPDLLAQHFLARAYTQGGGTNVVNVILVDFRGFDTLGEITVLGAVALAAFALLRRFRPAPDSVEIPEQQRHQREIDLAHPNREVGDTVADWLLLPWLISRVLFPIIAIVALYLLLRGHDLPGGGFVAGLTASIAIILQYMMGGTQWIEARLRVLPLRWMGAGLLLAAGTGAAAWFFGYPFLTSHFSYLKVPVIGQIPIASALLFDVGVFLLVVGAVVLILIALAHQSVRAHRVAPRPTAQQESTPVPEPVQGEA